MLNLPKVRVGEPIAALDLAQAGLLQAGKGCLVSPHAIFVPADVVGTLRPIELGDRCVIGAGAVLHGGVHLGAGVQVEDHTIVGGLGPFVRSLTGLDREAATAAFDQFQSGRTLSANQLHFLQLLIDFLARNGTVNVAHLYEPPFTSHAPGGPEDLFPEADVDEVVTVLRNVQATAIPTTYAA